jgi:pteridine reductase
VISPKVALVTGSGKRRIGWHVAEALARRGYSLAVHYRTSAAEAAQSVAYFQSLGAQAVALQAELTDEKAVQLLMQRILDQFGRLDVLVHCAAVWSSGRLEEVTAAEVRALLEVNTVAAFLCSQQAGLVMVRQPEGGSIINIGDWATARPYVDYPAYLISKGTIPTLTRCLAVELATRNPAVRVNCILPGPVMQAADLPPDEWQRAIRATLLQREGTPENIAQAVLFLVDNSFVTGVCLPVDGGRTIFAPDSLR